MCQATHLATAVITAPTKKSTAAYWVLLPGLGSCRRSRNFPAGRPVLGCGGSKIATLPSASKKEMMNLQHRPSS